MAVNTLLISLHNVFRLLVGIWLVIVEILLQSANALSPIVVKVDGNTIVSSFVQLLKALAPIVLTPLGIVRLVIAVLANADSPIDSKFLLDENTILFRLEHLLNAKLPIDVILSDNLTSLILPLPLNVEFAMATTVYGSPPEVVETVLGISKTPSAGDTGEIPLMTVASFDSPCIKNVYVMPSLVSTCMPSHSTILEITLHPEQFS